MLGFFKGKSKDNIIYSPRVGTPAAADPDQVAEELVKDRFGRLLELQNAISREKNEACTGKTFEVLCEGVSPSSVLF